MKIICMKKSRLKKQILIHNNVYKISYDSKSDKIVFDGMKNEDFPFKQATNLLLQFFKEQEKFESKSDDIDYKRMDDIFMDYLKSVHSHVFVSYEKQNYEISSFVILQENSNNSNYEHVRLLFVNPNYRKMKYGLNLLRFSENYALKNNKKGLTVCVLHKNERAKKLYSEYGFKEEYTFNFYTAINKNEGGGIK